MFVAKLQIYRSYKVWYKKLLNVTPAYGLAKKNDELTLKMRLKTNNQ